MVSSDASSQIQRAEERNRDSITNVRPYHRSKRHGDQSVNQRCRRSGRTVQHGIEKFLGSDRENDQYDPLCPTDSTDLSFLSLELHSATIDKLLHQYEQDVEQIKYEFREERVRIIRDHDISKTELQDIIYNMEKSLLDAETSAEQNFQANMEEQRNKVGRVLLSLLRRFTTRFLPLVSRRYAAVPVERGRSIHCSTE